MHCAMATDEGGESRDEGMPDEGWRKRCLERIAKEAVRRGFATGDVLRVLRDGRERGGRRGATRDELARAVKTLEGRRAWKAARRHAKWERRLMREAQLEREWGGEGKENNDDNLPEWYKLVAKTESSTLFAETYRFPSYEKGWKRFTRKPLRLHAQRVSNPDVISIDCEFIATTRSSKELASIAAIDGTRQVLLHSLVRPKGRVTNYKTQVTGLTEKDFKRFLTIPYESARRELIRMLKARPGAILVGHGLSNDLSVLKIDYRPVIDTSLLFQWRNMGTLLPGLKDLHGRLIGGEFREEGHHSPVEDAIASLDLAEFELRNGPTQPLEPPHDPSARCKLFIHDVSPALASDPERILTELWGSEFPRCGFVDGFSGERRLAAHVAFSGPEEADKAFSRLRGSFQLDSFGKPQKRVELPNGERLRVRKLSPESKEGIKKRGWARRKRRERARKSRSTTRGGRINKRRCKNK